MDVNHGKKFMIYIGIDDTDSNRRMCTTYIGALLYEKLTKKFEIIESRLIRLNPNIPYKTRGNASICLILNDSGKSINDLKEIVLDIVKKYADLEDENTNPGIVIYKGDVPKEFKNFYYKALRDIVDIKEAEKLASDFNAEYIKLKNGRGIIGALAAIGADLNEYTYELIAYRKPENWGKERRVDKESVIEMDKKTFPLTFNNYDYENDRVLITPHTPCPILYGIRGISKEILIEASEMVICYEDIDRVMIYKTNQATDSHYIEVNKIKDIKPYTSVKIRLRIVGKPKIIQGGHVIVEATDGNDKIFLAAYEPTKSFRNVIKELMDGDEIIAYGSVKLYPNTINLEKIEILNLNEYILENPTCPICNKKMESIGRNKGYRCRRCKTYARDKVVKRIERKISRKIYQVPPSAMRHLAKPIYLTNPISHTCQNIF